MIKVSFVFVLALCAFVSSVAIPPRVSFDGKCPVVKFVDDFDSLKFIGKWYSVKETGREIPCVSYDLEETRVNHYQAFVQPANFTIEFDKKNVEDYSEGFNVKLEFNPYMHGGSLKIFMTDYVNYAGVFICKESDDVHYQMISFWSRTRTMSDEVLESISKELAKYEVIDQSFMKPVKQVDCEAPAVTEEVPIVTVKVPVVIGEVTVSTEKVHFATETTVVDETTIVPDEPVVTKEPVVYVDPSFSVDPVIASVATVVHVVPAEEI